MRRPTPIAVGLTAALLALCWQYLVVHHLYGGNWTGLFYTGETTALPDSLANENIFRLKGSAGYDGVYYHIIAHDPFLARGFARYVDNPQLRWRRILVPGMANLLAAGQDDRVDIVYIAVTLFFVFLGTTWLSRYCTYNSLHPGWGLAFLAVPAVLVSIDRQTVDTAISALTVGLVLYSNREPWKASAVLAFLPLARETGLCLTAGSMIAASERRRWDRIGLAAVSTVPFLAWAWFVHEHTARDGTPWFSWPFAGLITRTLNPIQYALTGRWVTLAAILDYLAVIGIWIALAFAVYLVLRRPGGIAEVSLAVFAFAVIWVGRADVWGGAYEFGRTLSPLLVLLMMIAISTRQYRYLIPMALVLPRIALQYQPQVFGILSAIRADLR